jgi:hypothetical protein
MSEARTRYAVVGTGSRATMYIDAICGTYAGNCDLAALCDTSSVRMSYHNRRLADRYGRGEVPAYPAAEFSRMLDEQRPQIVIVTTPDAYHHLYIVSAMEHGCDVVSEKPMTTDAEKVAEILAGHWWIDAWPQTVYAMGSLSFYGREAAAARGESHAYSPHTGVNGDPFALDLGRSAMLRGLYQDAEDETGYVRNRNVFGEGVRVAITGDRGRAELYERHGAHVIEDTPTGEGLGVAGVTSPERSIRLFPMFRSPIEVDIPAEGGPHGGDGLMLEQIFAVDPPPDPWDRPASDLDGAASVLLGAAANRAMATGVPAEIADLGVALPVR